MAGPYTGRASLALNYTKGYADISADTLGQVAVVEGPREVAQAGELAIRIAQPSYLFDTGEGFPWFKYLSRWFPGYFVALRLDARAVLGIDRRIKSLPVLQADWKTKDNRLALLDFDAISQDDEILRREFSLPLE